MNEVSTIDRVIKIVSEQLDIDKEDKELNESTAIVDDLGADSLEVIELVMHLEEAFEIEMPEDEMSKLRTIGDIAEAIDRGLAKKEGK